MLFQVLLISVSCRNCGFLVSSSGIFADSFLQFLLLQWWLVSLLPSYSTFFHFLFVGLHTKSSSQWSSSACYSHSVLSHLLSYTSLFPSSWSLHQICHNVYVCLLLSVNPIVLWFHHSLLHNLAHFHIRFLYPLWFHSAYIYPGVVVQLHACVC